MTPADGSPLRLADIVREQEAKRARFAQRKRAPIPEVSTLPSGWKLARVGDLLSQPSPTVWLIRRLIDMDSLCCTFGASGSGKSFVVIDKTCCIATDTPYHGHTVKQGAAVYLAGEGHHGARKRFLAWSIEHGIDLSNAPLFISSAAIDLTGTYTAIVEAVRAACGDARPVYVVIDTLHRHLPAGANENSGESIGPFIAAADAIRQAFGCAVEIVHHTGHGAGERERGWSGIRGSLDWSYSVQKGDKGPVILQCRKAKDHDEPEPMQFALHSVALPWLDDEGEPETSAVLRVTGKTEAGMGGNQLLAMTALRKLAYEAKGELVTVTDWRKASGHDRFRWRETYTSLTERGLVVVEGDYVRLV